MQALERYPALGSATATATSQPLRVNLQTQSAPPSPSPRPLMYGSAESNSLNYLKRKPRHDQVAETTEEDPDPSLTGSPVRRSGSVDRPPLVRKKSGELVKPSLKPRPIVRTKSLPSTKTVHFATDNLVHVRRFNRTERPTAVNVEFGWSDSDCESESDLEEEPWVASTPNWTKPNYTGPDRPVVYLDSVYLTPDNAALRGAIFVKNIAYSKHVVLRYSADYWKTVSEIEATYTTDVRKKDRAAGYDRFIFTLPLVALPLNPSGYNATALFLAIRYTAGGTEYWDNNSNLNYEVLFRKGNAPPVSWSSLPLDSPQFANTGSCVNEVTPLSIDEQCTPKLRPQSSNPLKDRYSFGSAYSSPPRYETKKTNQAERVFPQSSSPSSLQTASYQDILNKYCFFTPGGNKKAKEDQSLEDIKHTTRSSSPML